MGLIGSIVRGSVSVTAVAFACVSAPIMAQDRAFQFSIPSQDLRASLRTLSRLTRQQIVFDGTELRGKKALALSGSYTVREGVERLLSGTGLTAKWGKTGVIVVRQLSAVTPVSSVTAAQDEPSQPNTRLAADEPLSRPAETEILVTGSRIQRQLSIDSPTPVVIIGMADLQAAGSTELSEILLDYPAVTTDSNLANTTSGINAAGLSTVSLRDLGPNRTLTLIDGRRTVSNQMTRNTVSMSTIPTMFVQRVEIITGGASAVYGTDAVAGVINIITRDKFDGLKIGARAGVSSQGDAQRYNIDALWGTSLFGDRASLVVGASYEKEGGFFASQRPVSLQPTSYAQTADLNPANRGELGINLLDLSSTTPGGRFLTGTTAGGGFFAYDASGRLFRTTDLAQYGYNTREELQIVSPRKSWLAAAKLNVDLGGGIELFAHGQYSNVKTDAFRGHASVAETSTYGVLDEFTVGRIPRANPFAPAAIRALASSAGIQWRRRFNELGGLITKNERETWRGWIGLKGEIDSNWKWELSYGYGRFNQIQTRAGTINLRNLQFALNAEFDPAAPTDLTRVRCVLAAARANGCVPVNVFGQGAISTAAANYIRADMFLDALVTQNTVQGYVSGELFQLPAGPVAIAVGGEFRRDWQRSTTDEVTRLGIGSSSFIAEFTGNIEAKEAFGEISVPLLKDRKFAHELTIEAAARVGNYNITNVGTVFSYRVGGGWAPVQGLKFRAQYAQSQRAPTITNLYSPLRDDAEAVTDLCNGVTAASTGTVALNCRSVPAIAAAITANGTFRQDITAIRGPSQGNPNLKEETAKTLTLGFVLSPSALRGLSLTVDYHHIRVTNAIGALSGTQLLNECYGNSAGLGNNQFCNPITRDPNGQLVQIINQDLNLDKIVRSGIDVGLDYRFNAPDFLSAKGRFDVRLLYSRLLESYTEFTGIAGITRTDGKGEIGSWINQGQFQLGYREGPVSLRWRAMYTGKGVDSNIRLRDATAAGSNPPFLHIGERIRHDLYASFDVKGKGSDMRFYLGIRNAFNSTSPFLPSGTASGGTGNFSGSYDVTGRYFYTGFEAKF